MTNLKQFSLFILTALCASVAAAKLPAPAPLTDEQKAKAEEVKAKAAETAKKDAELMGAYQDRAAKRYYAEQKAAGKTPAPPYVAPPAPPAPAAAPAAAAPAAVVSSPVKK
jgi:hypothetical protein